MITVSWVAIAVVLLKLTLTKLYRYVKMNTGPFFQYLKRYARWRVAGKLWRTVLGGIF